MKQLKYCLLSIFIVILMYNPLIAGQFSADVTIRVAGDTAQTGKIYVDGSKRRVEMRTPAGAAGNVLTAIVIDTDKKLGYVLLPEQKGYTEISDITPYVEGGKIINNSAAKQIGSELVNGYTCQILQINSEGIVQKYWYAKSLDFPVRIVTEVGGIEYSRTEYSNIKVQKQDPGLFVIPSDYKKIQ